ncbi:hypothetical protein SBOR_2301 [Sclerotinia borealis F-4128]|uniref:Ubiquitin-like modifier HUB1 n=1 Tax=Sclerotinia borealis (strain F-4128) TaxID=1432307 RepID=W9CMS6_SCLBF|nr:hypothetical protein SBOR_2301 [Sclerotinia borealis F-4128]
MAGLKFKKRARSRSPERDTDKTYRKRSRSPRRDRKRSPIREREREPRPSPTEAAADDNLDIAGKFGSSSTDKVPKKDEEGSKDIEMPEEEDTLDIASKFGASAFSKFKASSSSKPKDKSSDSSTPPIRPPAAHISTAVSASSAPSNEPMIIVHVNDRLGTKAAIPCLASDPIKLFKAQVAARIGRQPHEIMLKRQGERPFKDKLTLEDYGVGNGVQIDLEIDTGE